MSAQAPGFMSVRAITKVQEDPSTLRRVWVEEIWAVCAPYVAWSHAPALMALQDGVAPPPPLLEPPPSGPPRPEPPPPPQPIARYAAATNAALTTRFAMSDSL